MMLPNMTREELRRDFLADVPAAQTKLIYLKEDFGKLVKKTTRFPFSRWYPYTTKTGRGNRWLFCFIANKRSDWDNPLKLAFCLYNTMEGTGVVTAAVSGHPIFFTPHFFNRYIKRTGRTDFPAMDSIKEFLESHADIHVQIRCADCDILKSSGRYGEKYRDFECVVYEGEGIAIIDTSDRLYSTYVTFISDDLLHEDQAKTLAEVAERQKPLVEMSNRMLKNRKH